MLRVAAFQFLLHLLVAAVPETLEVLRDLDRPAGRGEEMEQYLYPSPGDLRRVGKPEHLLQFYRKYWNIAGSVIDLNTMAARYSYC